MSRKTISVEYIKTHVNELLQSNQFNESAREGMMILLEDILLKTNNYHGFQYLGKDELEHGGTPGIRWEWIGNDNRWVDGVDKAFEDTDRTRVKYY